MFGSTGDGGTTTVGEPTGADDADDDADEASGSSSPSFLDTETGACGEVAVDVERVIPTLAILVDHSISMNEDFYGERRDRAVYRALMEPGDGVISQLQDVVRFGLSLYSSDNGYGPDGDRTCPELFTVSPALHNRSEIDAMYAPDGNIVPLVEDTPTGESLLAVAQQLLADDSGTRKAIVLATDGEPDSCAIPDPQDEPDPAAAAALTAQTALDGARSAFDAGIQTFVISVGDDVSDNHLQQMANVGVGLPADTIGADAATFYRALDPQALVDAFEEIIGSFVTCEFNIEGQVDPDLVCDGSVSLDGLDLECGEAWDVTDDGTTLRFLGDACESLQDGGSHEVDARWNCEAIRVAL